MSKNEIVKSTFLVTVAIFMARVLGLVREMILANSFGASAISDAYIVAFTMPNTILACIGTAMGTVYIPMYHNVDDDKVKFTNNIMNLATLIGIVLTVFFCCFPNVLINLFASGFKGESYDYTVLFIPVMMLSTIPILLFNVLKSYLQIKNSFFLATILDTFINIFVILGILTSKYTNNVLIMAYATVLGNFMCLFVLYYSCSKKGLKYKFYLNIKDKYIKRMLKLVAPVFFAMAVAELNIVIDRNFASTLKTGTVSSMNYAGKINAIIYSFLCTAITTVLYPKMAEFVSLGKTDKLRKYLSQCISILSYIILPLSCLIIIMSDSFVSFMFKSGSFTDENVKITSQCVQIYAVSYLSTNINPLLIRFFYANNDTKTPTINSVLAVILNIVLNFILINRFKHIGLAFSTSFASIFTTAILMYQVNNKINGVEWKNIAIDTIKIILACALISLFAYNFWQYIFILGNNSKITILIKMGITGILSALIYILVTIFIKVGAVSFVRDMSIFNRRKKNG